MSWAEGSEQDCASVFGRWPAVGLSVNDLMFIQGQVQHNGEEKPGSSVLKCFLTACSGLFSASVYQLHSFSDTVRPLTIASPLSKRMSKILVMPCNTLLSISHQCVGCIVVE